MEWSREGESSPREGSLALLPTGLLMQSRTQLALWAASTLLAHIQLSVHQNTHVPLHRAALNEISLSVLMSGSP